MNTIEVGSVVKLADELFYAIDSTRMASIEYGIVNSKETHLNKVNHDDTIIEFTPLAYNPKLFKITPKPHNKTNTHTTNPPNDFIKNTYIINSNPKTTKKNNLFPLSCNNNVRLLYYFKPITPPLYLSVF